MTSITVSNNLQGPVIVLGAGLIGTSICLGLRGHGIPVFLSDPLPSNQASAIALGAGEALSSLTTKPELIVVAAPPLVTADVIARALADYPEATVIDIASTKTTILNQLLALGLDLERYVGTHPMTGREKSGPRAARGRLFVAMPWVLCPTAATSHVSMQRARALAVLLGAVVHELSPEAHDRIVALISHVPQVVATLVAARLRVSPKAALSLAGDPLRSLTRIAASAPELWVQIFATNSDEVLHVLRAFNRDLSAAIDALEHPEARGSSLAIAHLIEEGRTGQQQIPTKSKANQLTLVSVRVAVDDRPNILARMFTLIGNSGINIEDLRLTHYAGTKNGAADISVRAEHQKALVDLLTANKYSIH